MRPYPNAGKALRQLTRRDPDKVNQYRAELKYFHVPQRVILGMTNAYEVLDEAFTMTPSALDKLNILNQVTAQHIEDDIRAAHTVPFDPPW